MPHRYDSRKPVATRLPDIVIRSGTSAIHASQAISCAGRERASKPADKKDKKKGSIIEMIRFLTCRLPFDVHDDNRNIIMLGRTRRKGIYPIDDFFDKCFGIQGL